MKCSACGSEIQENDEACPSCGLPVEKQYKSASSSSPTDRTKHSRFGIASFVLSIVFTVLVFMLVGVSVFLHAFNPGLIHPQSSFVAIIGLMIFVSLLAQGFALILGIAGIVQQQRKRVFAVLGTCVSIFTILVVVGLMVIGKLAE